jgi:hypothetical protein
LVDFLYLTPQPELSQKRERGELNLQLKPNGTACPATCILMAPVIC